MICIKEGYRGDLLKSIKGTLPNVLTFINMSLGVVAILFAVNESKGSGTLISASLFIIIAALTDRFDGKVARMLNASSDLGKELDSLSDLISFGVAPIIIAWKISFVDMGISGYIISLIFPLAGAYRLARYNITSFNNVFKGIPITVAGAFLTLNNIYNSFAMINNKYTELNTSVTILLVILLSGLMVSKLKIKKI